MEDYITNTKRGGIFYLTGKHSLPNPAILHHLRSRRESGHRHWLQRSQTHPFIMYRPSLDLEAPDRYGGPMNLDQQVNCCNKTAPFYILPPKGGVKYPPPLLSVLLHNWLYDKWFRPYRSEIEFGQFISCVVCPKNIPDDVGLGPLLGELVKVNEYMREQVDELHTNFVQLAEGEEMGEMPKPGGGRWLPLLDPTDLDFFHLKPSFRAVAVVVDSNTFDYEAHSGDGVGQLPVYIIRTGIESGLSAPVTFDSIPDADITDRMAAGGQPAGGAWSAVRTTLDKAFDFLQALDQREVAAFGPRPAPDRIPKGDFPICGFCDGNFLREEEEDARRLGWEGDFNLTMSTATWVDTTLFPEWFGSGEDTDRRIMKGFYEEFYGRPYRQSRLAEESGDMAGWVVVTDRGTYF